MRRVYVHGAEARSPLGATWAETRAALAQGLSAVGPITGFDATGFPCTVAASIPERAPEGVDRRSWLAEGVAQAAWRTTSDEARAGELGVFIGAESGRATFSTVLALAQRAGGGAVFDHRRFGADARTLAPRIDSGAMSPATVSSRLAGRFSATGPVVTVSLACASGLAAIIEAVRAIRQGACEVALCGGVGADVDPLMLAGFGRLGILSAKGLSRPFDVRRDGFVIGEGAAILVLSAHREGARAEVLGAARTLDAHHLTAPHPEGRGAMTAMRGALDEARTSIQYVQAHGTSTPHNDSIEAAALCGVLGPAASELHVSSVKGALGHWVAGAGSVGFLCALEAVEHGVCLPTANLERVAADCATVKHVIGTAIEKPVHAAMVNAFAFGGANACAVIGALS